MGGQLNSVSPVRRQYLEMKRLHPDAILFFRLGDFYEMFDDDARVASEALQIALTSREMGKGIRVSMCGVPYHAAENYLARLLKAGHTVAICDQVGMPGAGLVDRRVTRVITPGTVVEDGMLAPDRNNYLAAVVALAGESGLAYADITTGEFVAAAFRGDDATGQAGRALARIRPAEVLLAQGTAVKAPESAHVTAADRWVPGEGQAEEVLGRMLGPAAAAAGLRGAAAAAAATVLAYLDSNQSSALHVFTSIHVHATGEHMELDEFTRRNLEILESSRDGGKRGSLLGVLDRTLTAMGARRLRSRLSLPLLDVEVIERRLDAVDWLARDAALRAAIRQELRHVGDLERTVARVRRGSVRPQDLQGLARSLLKIAAVARLLADPSKSGDLPLAAPDACAEVRDLLERAIDTTGDRIIRPGYSRELDEVYTTSGRAKTGIAELEDRLRRETGIRSLKVGHNRVFGYYVEVSKAASAQAPAEFEPRQTLANAQRYATPELKEYEAVVLNSEERAAELEQAVYASVVGAVAGEAGRLALAAASVAELDLGAALAEVATERDYARPTFNEQGQLDIIEGRHPVVEVTQHERFVPNECRLGGEHGQIIVLTGPNMAGKSTYLRQVALIALMAQIGSFVPAKSACLPVIDRVFTRVGARDDLAAGQSTFMVEMSELSAILSRATLSSLIVLDEIGRGTSTYDGLSIAKSVVEYLHNHPRLRAKTIFATHYHELTSLAERLPRVRNFNFAVAEQQGQVVFLRRIVPGASDRSYGIHVARLAGLPEPITRRAEEILAQLESANGAAGPAQLAMLPPERHPVLDEIEALDLESVSPLEALNKLYEWRRLLGS